MKKALLLLPLIILTACNNDGYIKCASIKFGDNNYKSVAPVKFKIGKYRFEDKSPEIPYKYGNNNEYIYVIFSIYSTNEKEPNFSEVGEVAVITNSEQRYQISFVYEIGVYQSYVSAYYSKSKKSIKYEECYYNLIKGDKDSEIQEKHAFNAYIDEGKTTISFNDYSSLASDQQIITKKLTTYISTGDEAVTYTIES